MKLNRYDVPIDEIKVGDWIGFKCDIEQSAEVVEIKVSRGWDGPKKSFVVKAPADGFAGGYIGRADFYEVDADDVF